jgi:Carboxypeptidase regulatory-like domain/TonB dependent receptor
MKRLFAALLLAASCAVAQINVTSVTGTVTDPTGAAVPGAAIQAVELATGVKFDAATNDKGEYTIPSLPAGAYRVSVNKAGFKGEVVENVALIVGVPGTVNVKLEVGQTSETVQVTAGAEIVQATTASVTSTLTTSQIVDLPFATRDAVELLVDVPGTSTPTTPRSSTVNGMPKGALNISIDGMNAQDNFLKSSDGYFSYIMASVDSLQEVSMSSSASGVDSTSQGGVQINFVTRSGTNAWHGGGFWQVRNTDFDANYYFNNQDYSASHPQGLPRDIVKLNQEGGHIGGPIKKNKLFFFGNVEIYRFPGTNTYSRTYLTPSASSGVYTYMGSSGLQSVNTLALAAAANPSLPAGTRPYPTTADPTFAKTYALMQSAGANGSVNNNQSSNDYNTLTTSYQPTGTDARDFFTARIDYNVTQKHVLSFVYNYNWYAAIPDFLNNIVPDFPGTGTVLFSNVSTGQRSNRFDGTLSLRSTLKPTLVNDLRVGLNGGTVLFFDLISPGLFAPWRGYNPGFASPGTTLSNVTTNAGPQRRNAPVKNVADTVSWVKGPHQVSFGGSFDQITLFQQIEGSGLFPGITLGIAPNDPIFTGNTSIFTASNFPGASTTQLSQAANLYADVVGRVSQVTQSVALNEQTHQYGPGAPIDRDRMREYGLFVQDQWRIAPNLTATLGLRFEKQGPLVNTDNLYTEVSYAGIWGISGVGNLFNPGYTPGQAPVYTPLSNPYNSPPVWAPSAGLAWSLPAADGFMGAITGHHTGASVLRGGYSIATVREGMDVFSSIYGQNQGLTQSTTITPATYPTIFGAPGSVEFSDPTIPSRNSTIAASPSYPIAALAGNSVYGIDPNLKMGYVQSWNVSFQRELDRNTVVDFRYTGNHGTDLWRLMNINEINILSNGYLTQFDAAANNLAIARGGNINNNTNIINFGNQGLPGQVAIPLISTALGTTTDATTASYLQLGQAGSAANAIATNTTRMASLTAAGYAANLFQVNPLGGGSANVLTNNGASYFNAFQVEVRHRLAKGFTISGSYQFAKNLADGATQSGSDTATPTTIRNMRLDRLPTAFDIRHAIKFNWIYELPFGPGKALNPGNAVAKKLVGGWQISGVARLQSGTPIELNGFATFNNTNSTTTAGGVVLHNITMPQLQSMMGIYKTSLLGPNGNIVYYLPPPTTTSTSGLNSSNNTNLIYNTQAAFNENGLTPAQVDPNAPYISPAAAGQLGNQDFLYLPWQRHFDLELQKNTRITEKVQLQIAASALDVLNMTNFLPGSNTNSTTFGQVTTAYRDISGTVDPGARIIEFKVRLNF